MEFGVILFFSVVFGFLLLFSIIRFLIKVPNELENIVLCLRSIQKHFKIDDIDFENYT